MKRESGECSLSSGKKTDTTVGDESHDAFARRHRSKLWSRRARAAGESGHRRAKRTHLTHGIGRWNPSRPLNPAAKKRAFAAPLELRQPPRSFGNGIWSFGSEYGVSDQREFGSFRGARRYSPEREHFVRPKNAMISDFRSFKPVSEAPGLVGEASGLAAEASGLAAEASGLAVGAFRPAAMNGKAPHLAVIHAVGYNC